MANSKRLSLIGVGRLGICLALVAERAGYDVLGADVLPQYVHAINNKTLHSSEPHVNEYLRNARNLRATTDMDEAIEFSDHLMVLVATPSTGGERHYDVTQLSRVLMRINARAPADKVVTICCTVLPGYIANIGRGLLSDCRDCVLQYNPEFIQQGNIVRGLECPDTVLIGEGSRRGGDMAERLWLDIVREAERISVHRMSAESAEIAKIALNCFVTMKISYANTISDVAECTANADKSAILRSIGADSRIGHKCLAPGYGFGGPCFPRDNRAFGGYAQSVGVDPVLSKATDAYNGMHAEHMANRLLAEERDVYVFEGVTYKCPCSVPIIEESQKLRVASRVALAGKRVLVRDRKDVIDACKMEWGSRIFEYEVVNDEAGSARGGEAVDSSGRVRDGHAVDAQAKAGIGSSGGGGGGGGDGGDGGSSSGSSGVDEHAKHDGGAESERSNRGGGRAGDDVAANATGRANARNDNDAVTKTDADAACAAKKRRARGDPSETAPRKGGRTDRALRNGAGGGGVNDGVNDGGNDDGDGDPDATTSPVASTGSGDARRDAALSAIDSRHGKLLDKV